MKRCPVCDRENVDDAITCAYCRRYLPQTEYGRDYSLVLFLKKNEALFTIMGVFLVLALIFNSPQFITLLSPQSNTITQFNCLIYEETKIPIEDNTSQYSRINCSSYSFENDQRGRYSDRYISNSMLFSFLCLWISILIFS